ncbi:MAG: MlaD family protein [Campylobacterota bacterium]|nr:MlaD family protein [Campylobacterota bacterium]
MQYSRIKVAVGVFVVALLGVIVSSFYFLLQEKGFFDKRYTYNFNIESAEFFSVGMPLKFSGFDVGVIDNIALRDDGRVNILFSVDEENKKWIREESFLTIKKPLIGSAYIVIDTNLTKSPLAEGSTLKIVQSDDINDMIARLEPVVKKIIKIIDNIDTITTYISSEDSDIVEILGNLNKFTKNLSQSDSLLTTVTGDKASTQSLVNAINEFNKSMQDIQSITHDVSQISDTFDKDIITPVSSSAKELNAIMKDIKHKLEVIDGTVNSIGSYESDLVDVKEQISVTMEKSDQLIEKIDSIISEDSDTKVVLP